MYVVCRALMVLLLCLSASLNLPERFADPAFMDVLQLVSDNARAEGKACGILLPDATLIPTLKEMGYTFVAVSSDVNVLTKHLKAIERALHG